MFPGQYFLKQGNFIFFHDLYFVFFLPRIKTSHIFFYFRVSSASIQLQYSILFIRYGDVHARFTFVSTSLEHGPSSICPLMLFFSCVHVTLHLSIHILALAFSSLCFAHALIFIFMIPLHMHFASTFTSLQLILCPHCRRLPVISICTSHSIFSRQFIFRKVSVWRPFTIQPSSLFEGFLFLPHKPIHLP